MQTDYAQNDSTAKDYIKNRPGGYEEGFEITWDGDTTGKTVVDINEDARLIKVSDAILSQEDVIGGTIDAGSARVFTISSEMITPLDGRNFALEMFVVIVADAPAMFAETELPEAGIYFTSAPSYGINVNSLSKLIVFQYDDKYIPDTIARKDEVYTKYARKENISITWDGNIENEDTFTFNSFLYYKMSDIAIPFEDVISVTSQYSDGNTSTLCYSGTNCYKTGYGIVVTKAGACKLSPNNSSTILSFSAPSTGIYFFYRNDTQAYQTSLNLSYRQAGTGLLVNSPNKKWAITVDDSGNISAVEITK